MRLTTCSALIALALPGCFETQDDEIPEGNTKLGIVKFVEDNLDDQTTLRGLDASGDEVARLDLVHGRFTVSPPFTDDYNTPDVDGRKLTVNALGQQMHYETAGFDPILKMPAHPPAQWKLAAFLDDPHAKRILDRWQLGFLPFEGVGDGEVPYGYVFGNFRGDNPMGCDGQATCGTGYFGTINLCPGGNAFQAQRLTRQPGSNCGLYTGPTNPEILVAQCCPATTGILGVPWFAYKACPTTNNTSTSCGTVPSGACKGCPEYPVAQQYCYITLPTNMGSCSGTTVYQIDWSYLSPVLADGGFEGQTLGTVISPWSVLEGSVQATSTGCRSGTKCLVTGGGPGSGASHGITQTNATVTPGQVYQFSVWAKKASSTYADLWLVVKRASGQQIVQATRVVNMTTYKEYAVSFTVPTGVTSIKVEAYYYTEGPAGTIDDVSVY